MQTLSKQTFLVKAPDIQERYAGMGIFATHTTPERVVEIMKMGAKQMGAVVKAAGIQPE